MIADTINQQIARAMKAKDETRLSTLRLLSSALNYERIARGHNLSEDEELSVVRREVKKRQEAIDVYEKVGAKDRADQERKEQEILKEFLPPELSQEEVEKIVEEAIAFTGSQGLGDFGKVMAEAMRRAAGMVDGKKVAEIVTKKLSQK